MKTILWNNDGVLVDTEPICFECTRNVSNLVGVELTHEGYLELGLIRGVSTFTLAKGRGISDERIQELRVERDRQYVEGLRTEPVAIDGVASALERLGEGHSMGVVTTSRSKHFDLVHGRTGLAQHFDFIVALGDYGRAKPAPDPCLAALERNGLWAEECVAVED
jgi:HAD superfamily hydrolase (TIGR01509 family)